ncbi:TPA: hypothetical protein N3282_004328 [Klebsiella aerogenes]|nr:hypothetical protein [Klebsiella aerogenes]
MMIRTGNFLFRTRNMLFPLLYLVLFSRGPMASDHDRLALVVGCAIILIGQAIRVLTVGLDYIVRGGRNKKVYADGLVQNGLFAHCRNPLYLGNLLMIIGMGIASDNLYYLLIAMPLLFVAYACIIAAEEHYLLGCFGEQYSRYMNTTPRLLPALKGLMNTLRDHPFNWQRVLVKEYSTLCISLLVMIALSYQTLNPEMPWQLALSLMLMVGLLCAGIRGLKKRGILRSRAV